jgi:hypothetical protein
MEYFSLFRAFSFNFNFLKKDLHLINIKSISLPPNKHSDFSLKKPLPLFGDVIPVDCKNQTESTNALYIKNVEVVISDT